MKKSARSVSVYILRTQQKCMNLFSSRQAPSAIIGNRHYWKKKLNEVRKGQKGPKGQKVHCIKRNSLASNRYCNGSMNLERHNFVENVLLTLKSFFNRP